MLFLSFCPTIFPWIGAPHAMVYGILHGKRHSEEERLRLIHDKSSTFLASLDIPVGVKVPVSDILTLERDYAESVIPNTVTYVQYSDTQGPHLVSFVEGQPFVKWPPNERYPAYGLDHPMFAQAASTSRMLERCVMLIAAISAVFSGYLWLVNRRLRHAVGQSGV